MHTMMMYPYHYVHFATTVYLGLKKCVRVPPRWASFLRTGRALFLAWQAFCPPPPNQTPWRRPWHYDGLVIQNITCIWDHRGVKIYVSLSPMRKLIPSHRHPTPSLYLSLSFSHRVGQKSIIVFPIAYRYRHRIKEPISSHDNSSPRGSVRKLNS